VNDLISANTETISVLKGMLTESTGSHFLDSGGDDGRHWQRNQRRDFESEPYITYPHGCLIPSINVFQWLSERLTFDSVKTKAIRDFGDKEELYGLELAEAYVEHHHKDAGGIYGEGTPFTVNTYNNECALAQTLQFVYFNVDGDAFVALQIHNGADVRGGYTDPQVFKVDCDGTEIFNFADSNWQCDRCAQQFYTDNAGYTWYREDDWRNKFRGEDVPVTEGQQTICPSCAQETQCADGEDGI